MARRGGIAVSLQGAVLDVEVVITDLEPDCVNISSRLEDTHSESPRAHPEVRTRTWAYDSQRLA